MPELELWPHQQAAVEHTLYHWGKGGGACVWSGIGSGKTAVAIEACRIAGLSRVLVVCGQKVADVWQTQWPQWDLSRSLCLLHKGPIPKRAQHLLAALQAPTPLAALVNYEAMWRPQLGRELERGEWDALIVDESHRIQAPGGKQSRWLGALARKIPSMRRLLLSGTPISGSKSVFAAWAQYRCADRTIFPPTYAAFRAHFSHPVNWGEDHDFLLPAPGSSAMTPWAYRRMPEFLQKFGSIAYTVKTADVLKLPDHVHVRRTFDLEPSAAKIYREMERHMLAEIEGGILTAANALVKLRRLSQIASGWSKTAEGLPARVSTAKQQALEELLEDLPLTEPVVLFAVEHNVLDMLHQASANTGRRSLEISGRANQLGQWQQGGAPVLVAQINSGSEGIDATRARYTVFAQNTFSALTYTQACGRTLRPNQRRSVVYVHLVAQKTVDVDLLDSLEHKGRVVDAVLSAIQKRKH